MPTNSVKIGLCNNRFKIGMVDKMRVFVLIYLHKFWIAVLLFKKAATLQLLKYNSIQNPFKIEILNKFKGTTITQKYIHSNIP